MSTSHRPEAVCTIDNLHTRSSHVIPSYGELRRLISKNGIAREALFSKYVSVYLEAKIRPRLEKVAIWNKKTNMLHLRHPLELDSSLSHKEFRSLCSTRGLTLDELIKTNSDVRVTGIDFQSRMEKFCRFDKETRTYHLFDQDYSIVRELRTTFFTSEISGKKEEAAVDSGVEELIVTRAQRKINAARKVEPSEATRLRREKKQAKTRYKVQTLDGWVKAQRSAQSYDISTRLRSSEFEDQILQCARKHKPALLSNRRRFIVKIIHNISGQDTLNDLLPTMKALVQNESPPVLINDWQTYRPGVDIPDMPQLQQMFRNYHKIKDLPKDNYWTLAQRCSWGATIVHAWRTIKDSYVKHRVTQEYQNMDLIPLERDKLSEYMRALVLLRRRPHAYAVYTLYFKEFDPDANPGGKRAWEHEFSTRKRLLACELAGIEGDDRFRQPGARAFIKFRKLYYWARPYFELEQAFGGHGIFLVQPKGFISGVANSPEWCFHVFAKEVLDKCPDVRKYIRLLTKNVLVPAFAGEREQLCRLPLLAPAVDWKKTTLIDLVTVRDP